MKPYGWPHKDPGSTKKDPHEGTKSQRKAMRSRARHEARVETRAEEPIDMNQYRYETEGCDPGCEVCGDARGGP